MTTQTYRQASQRFLAQAKEELAAGDLQQASEKGWGATAQILKAVAEQRGWEHSRHRHHLVTVSRLRTETGARDIRRLFNTASALHENFYENTMSTEDIAESLDDVQALLDRLVVRQRWIDGYRDFSLMRASWVVKRQSTRIASRLR